jgi:hypothetical protein
MGILRAAMTPYNIWWPLKLDAGEMDEVTNHREDNGFVIRFGEVKRNLEDLGYD